jgi:hypothetical protein
MLRLKGVYLLGKLHRATVDLDILDFELVPSYVLAVVDRELTLVVLLLASYTWLELAR